MLDVNGISALVTGGASGFGLGIVKCFIEEGAKVLIADINGASADKQAAALGGNASGYQVDVTDSAAVKLMMRCRLENTAFGPLPEDRESARAAAEQCRNEELLRSL